MGPWKHSQTWSHFHYCDFKHNSIYQLIWGNLCSKSTIKIPEQRPRAFVEIVCCWFWTGTCPLFNVELSVKTIIFSITSFPNSTCFIIKHLEKHCYVVKIRFLVTLTLLLIAINAQIAEINKKSLINAIFRFILGICALMIFCQHGSVSKRYYLTQKVLYKIPALFCNTLESKYKL